MRNFIWWLCVIVFFVLLALPFLLPSFSLHCTEQLLNCIETGNAHTFWGRLWAHLGCVYNNVICVLGGLFK